MKYLLPVLLLVSTASASPSATEDEVMQGFIKTTTCTSIVGGATLNEEASKEDLTTLKVAYYYYAKLSVTAAEWLIADFPGWEDVTYEQMFDLVVDKLEQFPKTELQTMGEACMDVFFEIVKEKTDDKDNPKIHM
jgi:hypothetical protein